MNLNVVCGQNEKLSTVYKILYDEKFQVAQAK